MDQLVFGVGRSAALVLLVSGMLALACGKTEDDDDDADCASLCERAAECPDASDEDDCASDCAELEGEAERVGCSEVWGDFLSCVSSLRASARSMTSAV